MKIAQGYRLCKLWKQRRISHIHYIRFQKARAELIQKELQHFVKQSQGKKLLDIGSHRGGYSIAFAQKGYRVTGIEVDSGRVATAQQAAQEQKLTIPFLQGDARDMPFQDNEFDIAILSNVIEHIPNTPQLLTEIYRILKPQGILYIQFPPYQGWFGGHVYWKFMPLPLHYLPRSLANTLIQHFHLDSELHEVEQITLKKIKKLSKSIGFKIKLVKTIPSFMGEYAPFCKVILEK